MTTIDLLQHINTASYSTLPIYKAKIARMHSEGEMPLSLSNLLDQKILLRESQLLLAGTLAEEIEKGNDVSQKIEEARKVLTEDDYLYLRHALKMRKA